MSSLKAAGDVFQSVDSLRRLKTESYFSVFDEGSLIGLQERSSSGSEV